MPPIFIYPSTILRIFLCTRRASHPLTPKTVSVVHLYDDESCFRGFSIAPPLPRVVIFCHWRVNFFVAFPRGEVVPMYITWEQFLLFGTLIVALIELILSIHNKKK